MPRKADGGELAREVAAGLEPIGRVEFVNVSAQDVGEEFVDYSPEAAARAVENSTPVEGRAEYDMAMDLARAVMRPRV